MEDLMYLPRPTNRRGLIIRADLFDPVRAQHYRTMGEGRPVRVPMAGGWEIMLYPSYEGERDGLWANPYQGTIELIEPDRWRHLCQTPVAALRSLNEIPHHIVAHSLDANRSAWAVIDITTEVEAPDQMVHTVIRPGRYIWIV